MTMSQAKRLTQLQKELNTAARISGRGRSSMSSKRWAANEQALKEDTATIDSILHAKGKHGLKTGVSVPTKSAAGPSDPGGTPPRPGGAGKRKNSNKPNKREPPRKLPKWGENMDEDDPAEELPTRRMSISQLRQARNSGYDLLDIPSNMDGRYAPWSPLGYGRKYKKKTKYSTKRKRAPAAVDLAKLKSVIARFRKSHPVAARSLGPVKLGHYFGAAKAWLATNGVANPNANQMYHALTAELGFLT